jgi:hypothetical protein
LFGVLCAFSLRRFTREEIELMRESAFNSIETLGMIASEIKEGVTTYIR